MKKAAKEYLRAREQRSLVECEKHYEEIKQACHSAGIDTPIMSYSTVFQALKTMIERDQITEAQKVFENYISYESFFDVVNFTSTIFKIC